MFGDPQKDIAGRLTDWRQGKPQGPYTLELYPTLRCNLDCAFCDTTYRKKQASDELSRSRYLRLADEAAELEIRRCYILGGGEPLVARHITPDIMARLKSHGIFGILGTNGTLFHQGFLEQVVEMGWDEIHFSLDGATPEVNDRIRGQSGVFARVTEVMGRLNRLKRERGSVLPRTLIHAVVTRWNHEQLGAMVSLAHRLGCFRINFDALIAYRPEQEELKLEEEERLRLAQLAEAGLLKAAELGIETTLEQFLETRTLERGEMSFERSKSRDVTGAICLNPWHHIVVQHNGTVGPCCVLPPEASSDTVRDRDLADVWFKGDTFARLRELFVSQQTTRHCKNCSMALIGQNDAVRNHLARESR